MQKMSLISYVTASMRLAFCLPIIACNSVPAHRSIHTAKAQLEALTDSELYMCENGSRVKLYRYGDHYVVPAGKKITLFTEDYLYRDKGKAVECEGGISFIPSSSANYLAVFPEHVCGMELWERDTTTNTREKVDYFQVHPRCFFVGSPAPDFANDEPVIKLRALLNE